MSRAKKTRSLKGKLKVKTGSKKDFIGKGEKGRIPSHNRLAKHKKRQKSVYQKHLEENNLTDSSAGAPKPGPTPAPAVEPEEEPVQQNDAETEVGFDELSGDELLKRFEQDQ